MTERDPNPLRDHCLLFVPLMGSRLWCFPSLPTEVLDSLEVLPLGLGNNGAGGAGDTVLNMLVLGGGCLLLLQTMDNMNRDCHILVVDNYYTLGDGNLDRADGIGCGCYSFQMYYYPDWVEEEDSNLSNRTVAEYSDRMDSLNIGGMDIPHPRPLHSLRAAAADDNISMGY